MRIGNAASDQLQLDVYGEVLDALYQARRMGLSLSQAAWNLERELVAHLEKIWHQPDEGLWEVRGGRRQFTHSKVMAWVAFDRAVRSIEEFGLPGPAERWRALREKIHEQVCREGFNSGLNSLFSPMDQTSSTQVYCSCRWSASCQLMTPGSWEPWRPSKSFC